MAISYRMLTSQRWQERGLALCSTDGDFAPFPGVRWQSTNPLTKSEMERPGSVPCRAGTRSAEVRPRRCESQAPSRRYPLVIKIR
jgi:hypothetical protein